MKQRNNIYDARAAANFVVEMAGRHRLALTPMAIQKILYYAHGWHLARTGSPFLKQEFEAWEFGPVIGCLYAAFKKFGGERVLQPATWFDPVSETTRPWTDEFDQDVANLLQSIVMAYGHIDAYELSKMTHRSGGPWDRVWNNPNNRISLGMKISNEAIRDDFLHFRAQNTPSDYLSLKIFLASSGNDRLIH